MQRLTILTVATKPGGYYDMLVRSCKEQGLNLTVVGLGQEWKGWTKRLEWIGEAMMILPPDDIVLVCDAYDVFFLAGPDEIVAKYQSLNCSLLIGGDSQGNQPLQQLSSQIFFNRTGKSYASKEYFLVCAGTYITTPRYFLNKIYRDLYRFTVQYQDDQVAFTSLALLHPEKVTIDHDCVLFQTIFPCPGKSLLSGYNLEWQGRRLRNKTYNTYPVLVHGGGNTNLCPLIYTMYPDAACKAFTFWEQASKTLTYAPSMARVLLGKCRLCVLAMLAIILYFLLYRRQH